MNKSTANNKRTIIAEIFIYVIILLLCVFFVPKYVIQRTIVNGTSMENTLHNNDNLMVEKLSYRFSEPKRFDVIVFYPYGKQNSSEYFVKRIIGLPGETIQIINDDILINGEIIEENYGKDPIVYSGIATEPLQLDNDEYFVIGDNRNVSFDSRYPEIGPVTKDKIEGKVLLRIYPFNAISVIK